MNKIISKKKAFSTAELMIAIAVLGALAAMMIPSLRYSVNKAIFNHSREIQRQKLAQGITLLSIRSPRMGFLTTESFVIELSKYARISKYCNSEKISNCWPYKEVELVDGTKYDMSGAGESDVFITEDNLNPDDYIYANDNVSFVTDNGTAVLINYNTRCNPEANDENNTCYMALMDVNGDKTPNKVGEDIFLINAKGFVVSEKLETCGVNQCPKPPSQL